MCILRILGRCTRDRQGALSTKHTCQYDQRKQQCFPIQKLNLLLCAQAAAKLNAAGNAKVVEALARADLSADTRVHNGPESAAPLAAIDDTAEAPETPTNYPKDGNVRMQASSSSKALLRSPSQMVLSLHGSLLPLLAVQHCSIGNDLYSMVTNALAEAIQAVLLQGGPGKATMLLIQIPAKA